MMDAVDAAVEVVMRTCRGDVGPGGEERRERVLLRPWLENLIHSGLIPGLEWIDVGKTMFKVPWKHRSKKNWSLRHSSVFLEWAKNTGRWKEGDPEPNYAQLKTRLRCAFNKAPDIDEIKELHCTKSEEPYKVYRFSERRDGKSRPLMRMFITRSSKSQTPRRRRRPRNNAAALALEQSSIAAETTSASYYGNDLKRELLSAEMRSYYGECLVKVEPPADVISRTFTTQFYDLPVPHPSVSVPMKRHDFGLASGLPSQRILPPPELDCPLATSKWSPPFPICPEHLSLYRNFSSLREPRESGVESYPKEAATPVDEAELHSALEDAQMDERYDRMSQCKGVACTSYELNTVPSTVLPRCPSTAPSPTILPPVQSSTEMESSDAAAILPPCEDDDSMPPLVRFKNRYRRAMQMEGAHQRQLCETTRDWNDNETDKTCEVKRSYSPILMDRHRAADDMFCVSSSSQMSAADAVRCDPVESRDVVEETRLCDKRTWSRVTPEVDLTDAWMSSSKIACRDVQVDAVHNLSKQPELPARYQQIVPRSWNYQNCVVSSPEQKFNPDGRLDTSRAAEIHFQNVSSLHATALNLSNRTTQNVSETDEAVDLSTKTLSPANNCFVSSTSAERKTNSDHDATQGNEYKRSRDQPQGVDCVASDRRRSFDAVDIGRVEADFRRKSELIQTKTAVLCDKERELRLLAHQLAARERAISWQERQLDIKTSSKLTSRPSSTERWQEAEKYRCQVKPQEPRVTQHHAAAAAAAVLEHHQHVRPPDVGVQISPTGCAVDKLEKQFARMAHTRVADVSSQQSVVCHNQPPPHMRESSEIQPRIKLFPFHPDDRHLNVASLQHRPTLEYSSIIRKRGRPKGSKNRYKVPPAAFCGMSAQQQWMNKLYVHNQMVPNNAVADRRNLAEQMAVSCRPPGTTSNGTLKMLPNEQLKAYYRAPHETPVPPPLPVLESQCTPGTSASAAVIPTRVQQLLASTAFTTGASILPPLSPVAAAECHGSMAGEAGNAFVARRSIERGIWSGGDDDGIKDISYRVEDSSATADDQPDVDAGSEEGAVVSQCFESHHNQLSDQVMCTTDSDAGHCSPLLAQSSKETRHILPKVSSFDSTHCWNSEQSDEQRAWPCQLSTMHDNVEADADDNRLFVVIDDD